MENDDPRHAEAILDSLKFKDKEKIKIEELQETVADKVKLKKQKTGTGIKILTPNRLLTGLYLLYQHNKITQQFNQVIMVTDWKVTDW